MGLALSVLGPASLSESSGLVGAGSRSVAARHAGLMLGLLLIAPVLGHNLESKANDSALAGTRSLLEAQLPLRQKIPVAWALRKEIQQTPDGEVPDVDAVFAAHGAGDSPALASARDGLVGTIESILTRAFRSSFLIAAALALLALLPLLALTLGRAGAAAAAATRGPVRLGSSSPGSSPSGRSRSWSSSGRGARTTSAATRRRTPARPGPTPIRARDSTTPSSASRSAG